MIEIAICDDELYVLGQLEKMLGALGQSCGGVEIDAFQDGESLVKAVEGGTRYDIVYIDIQMNRMDGLEAAQRIRNLDRIVQLVYVTAHESYMKDAFRVSPIGFITKPVEQKEFEDTFHYILKRIENRDEYYRFQYKKASYKMAVRDILYFESDCRIVNIVCEQEHYKVYSNLNNLEKELKSCSDSFLRIHKSFLVNYRHVVRFEYDGILLSDGRRLPLSRTYRKTVEEYIRGMAGGI